MSGDDDYVVVVHHHSDGSVVATSDHLNYNDYHTVANTLPTQQSQPLTAVASALKAM